MSDEMREAVLSDEDLGRIFTTAYDRSITLSARRATDALIDGIHAAIAAATPYIEVALLSRLAEKADQTGEHGLSFCNVCDCAGRASDWLREQAKEAGA